MSIRVMSAVWDHAPYEGGTLLVLLALADWADDSGICWPSAKRIAEKARLGERQVHNILKRFRSDGIISVEPGGGRGVANRYRFNPQTLNLNSVKPNSVNCNSLKSTTETLQPSSENTAICDIAIRKNRQEPSIEPSAKKRSLKTPLPEDFSISESVRRWATEHKHAHLDERLEHFIDWARGGGKKYADWDATFRNAIRGDWAHLNPNGNGNGNRSPGKQKFDLSGVTTPLPNPEMVKYQADLDLKHAKAEKAKGAAKC